MNAVKKRTFKLAKKCAHQNGKYNKNPVNKLNYTRNVGMSSNGNVYWCIFSLNFWWFFTIFMAFAWTTHSIIIQTYFFLPFYYSVQKIKKPNHKRTSNAVHSLFLLRLLLLPLPWPPPLAAKDISGSQIRKIKCME